MMYRYKSPVGSFTISPTGNGQFELYINKLFLASYRTPEAASLDVALHATGYKEWDLFPGHVSPQNLFDWELWRIKKHSNQDAIAALDISAGVEFYGPYRNRNVTGSTARQATSIPSRTAG